METFELPCGISLSTADYHSTEQLRHILLSSCSILRCVNNTRRYLSDFPKIAFNSSKRVGIFVIAFFFCFFLFSTARIFAIYLTIETKIVNMIMQKCSVYFSGRFCSRHITRARNLSRGVRLLHGWGDRRRRGGRGRVVVAAPVWPPGIDSRCGARGDVMASRLRQ